MPLSSTQAALAVLMEDGLVSCGVGRPPRYRIEPRAREDVDKILEVASRRADGERLLAAALRANPSVEFVARDQAGLLLVIRWDAEPSDEVRLAGALGRSGIRVARLDHDEVRERVREDPSLRERARQGRVIIGSVERSFPDPYRHGSPEAPLLGHLHPELDRPSRSALTRIARRYGLAEMRVFGSAVHADFRPDPDVDVLVRRKPGVRRTLQDDVSLRRALEDLLGRDVDVIDESVTRRGIRARAISEGVVLYG